MWFYRTWCYLQKKDLTKEKDLRKKNRSQKKGVSKKKGIRLFSRDPLYAE
jgi:hypothetical protein